MAIFYFPKSAILKVKIGFTMATWQSQYGENPTQIIPIFQERHHSFFMVFPLKISGSLLLEKIMLMLRAVVKLTEGTFLSPKHWPTTMQFMKRPGKSYQNHGFGLE